jgi:predicted nuclease with TOPRIM domain
MPTTTATVDYADPAAELEAARERISDLEAGLANMVDAATRASDELGARAERIAELDAERSRAVSLIAERDERIAKLNARIDELENELGIAGEAQDERRAR